jgi:hypothetical protein
MGLLAAGGDGRALEWLDIEIDLGEILARGIFDCLFHHAEMLTMVGPAFRLKDRLNFLRARNMGSVPQLP